MRALIKILNNAFTHLTLNWHAKSTEYHGRKGIGIFETAGEDKKKLIYLLEISDRNSMHNVSEDGELQMIGSGVVEPKQYASLFLRTVMIEKIQQALNS